MRKTKQQRLQAELRAAQWVFKERGESLSGYLSFYAWTGSPAEEIQRIYEADKAHLERLKGLTR